MGDQSAAQAYHTTDACCSTLAGIPEFAEQKRTNESGQPLMVMPLHDPFASSLTKRPLSHLCY